MKKALKKTTARELYHFVDGVHIDGAPASLRGDVSGLEGDVDECELSDDERAAGVDVNTLIGEED